MKDILKCMGLLFVGLFVAVIVYPFLHEAGHSVVAISVGAKVIDFNLFPLPYVACEVSRLNKISIVLIGLAGMFIPAIISIIFRPKSFWLWYGSFVMSGTCLLSLAISLVATILYLFGVTIKNEDIVQVIDAWNDGVFFIIISMLLSIVVIICSIMKQKPLNRIMAYFNVPMKKSECSINHIRLFL